MRKKILILIALGALGIAFFAYSRYEASQLAKVFTTTSTSTKNVNGSIPTSITEPSKVVLQSADLTKIAGGPMLSFNFDDGLKSVYEKAIPLFNKAGFKTSQYIITGAFTKVNYVTQAQVLEMYAQGHEIGAHTRTHPHLSALPEAQARDEIVGSKQDLIALGITPTTFVYPFGDQNTMVKNIVKEADFVGARITIPEFNDRTVDPFLLKRQRVQADTTFIEVKKAIDNAVAKKKWIILVLHGVDGNEATDTKIEMIQNIVDYVKQVNIPVVTTAEGLHILNTVK